MSQSDPLIVYAGWAAFGVADFSPACLKLKTYLRMAGFAYEARRGDPRQGPTKKIPYLSHAGNTLGDSGLIIAYLKKALGDPLDQRLTDEEHALGHLVRRTTEESLYWVILQSRWADDEAWPKLAQEFRGILPPVVGSLIVRKMRQSTLDNIWAQGLGRHTKENIFAHGCADIDALASFLKDKIYLFGDTPTSYDATLYGFLANAIALPSDGQLAQRVRQYPHLVAFVERVTAQYWATPDSVK